MSHDRADSDEGLDVTRVKLLEEELVKFKQIITQQEDVILSQNNNIYVSRLFLVALAIYPRLSPVLLP